jgi:hypothetical protein
MGQRGEARNSRLRAFDNVAVASGVDPQSLLGVGRPRRVLSAAGPPFFGRFSASPKLRARGMKAIMDYSPLNIPSMAIYGSMALKSGATTGYQAMIATGISICYKTCAMRSKTSPSKGSCRDSPPVHARRVIRLASAAHGLSPTTIITHDCPRLGTLPPS